MTSATSIPVRTLVSAMGHIVMWAVGKARKAPRVCAAALARPLQERSSRTPVLHHAASTHVGIVVYAHTHHLSYSLGDCGAPERYARLPAARKQRRKLPPSAARSHDRRRLSELHAVDRRMLTHAAVAAGPPSAASLRTAVIGPTVTAPPRVRDVTSDGFVGSYRGVQPMKRLRVPGVRSPVPRACRSCEQPRAS